MTADQLRYWCEGHGYSLKGLARALGMSERMVRRYAAGDHPIPRRVELALDALERDRDLSA